MKTLSRYTQSAKYAFLAALIAMPALAAPVAKKAQPDPKPSMGPVANYAAQGGVRQCLGRIDQLSNFLTAGATSGANVFINPREPDRGLTSVSMEVQGNNGLSYVATAFSPAATSCDGTYEAITYWGGSCDQVAASFPGFKRVNPLRQHIQTLDGGPYAKVYLMPAGQGCISIKKETVY
ncbi:MAG: hypothetical protein Q7U78_14790 [Gallionella sp.]|nr:hypothetical protein [Gallionella sp.]MDO9013048.1 hypothetical protein [Gallionella sp.]